ncbi:hypothetical protein IF2G_09326 [Cordyceps javanica]|nr:hypothetical protein IF2G_09326 [Cordyceps javanica]
MTTCKMSIGTSFVMSPCLTTHQANEPMEGGGVAGRHPRPSPHLPKSLGGQNGPPDVMSGQTRQRCNRPVTKCKKSHLEAPDSE